MASIHKSKDHRGTFWVVRWRGPEGERKRRSRSKAAADQLLVDATAEEAKRRDPLAYRASANVSLGFVIDRWWAVHAPTWAGTTRSSRQGIINNRVPAEWKTRPIRRFHSGEIQQLLRDISESVGKDAVSKVRTVLNLVWEFALLEGYASENPISKTKVPKKASESDAAVVIEPVDPDEVLSGTQVREIADAIRPKFRELVLVLGIAGLRIGEAAVLQVKHVDLGKATISVVQARDASPTRHRTADGLKAPKSKKGRTVFLYSDFVEELRPLVEGREPDEWLFTGVRGKRLNVDSWRKNEWRPVVERLEYRQGPYEYVTPHWLRHTAATSLLKAGVPPGSICAQFGWDNTQTFFQTYVGYFAEDAEEIRRGMRKAWDISEDRP